MDFLDKYTEPRNPGEADNVATPGTPTTPGTQPQAETVDFEKDLIFEETEIPNEQFLLKRGKDNGARLLPLANLSILKAKMKNGKSFLCTLFASAVISENWENQIFAADVTGAGVIYIDTEQSPASTKKIRQRVTKLFAVSKNKHGHDIPPQEYEKNANVLHDSFIIANVRKYNVLERVKRIEAIIKHYPAARLLILDGIKDICTDFNNIQDVAVTMDTVTRWALDYNIHIICVLHENPGSDKARGHLGTELYNKATEIVNVERQELDGEKINNFAVKWDAIRDGDGVEPFNFSVEVFGVDAIPIPRYNAEDLTAYTLDKNGNAPAKQSPRDKYKRNK